MSDSSPLPLPPLSSRFLQFAKPELPPVEQEAEFLATARVVGIGWNRAVFAEGSLHAEQIDRYLATLPLPHRAHLQALYAELILRKRRLFPDDSRLVVDVQLKRSGNTVSLQVTHSDVAHLSPQAFLRLGLA